jgi:hypothetical protein
MRIEKQTASHDVLSALSNRPRHDPIHLGQVVCLGLDRLRDKLGDAQWRKARSLVLSLVEKMAAQVCDPRDVVLPCRDGSYVIVFATAVGSIAEARATKIAARVNEALFGTDGVEGVTIHSAVETADGLGIDSGRSVSDVIGHLLQGAGGCDLAMSSDGGHKPGAPTGPDAAEAAAHHPPVEGAANAIPHCRESLYGELAALDNAPISFAYLPLWEVRLGRVATFHCLPMRAGLFGEAPRCDYAVLGDGVTTREIVDLDIAGLEHGLLAQCKRLRAGFRQHLSVNIHFETLGCSYGRGKLFELLRDVPAPVRAVLTARLVGIPEGVPEARLIELTGRLAPFVHGCSAVVQNGDPQGLARTLRRLRSAHVGTAVMNAQEGEGGLRDARSVVRFVAACRDSGVRTCAFDVASREEALTLSHFGFDLIMGPMLGGPFETLPEPYQVDGRTLAPERPGPHAAGMRS